MINTTLWYIISIYPRKIDHSGKAKTRENTFIGGELLIAC